MHEELEVGARARLPDAEEKSSDGKRKKKLKFEKEELDGVGEDKNADSSSFSNDEVPRQVKVKENQGFLAPIIVRTATIFVQ